MLEARFLDQESYILWDLNAIPNKNEVENSFVQEICKNCPYKKC